METSEQQGSPAITVTGAGGFIGSALLRRLSSLDLNVSALLAPAGEPARAAPSGVRAAVGSIEDVELLTSLMEGSEVVVHLAGPPSVARSFDDPRSFAAAHVCGTAAVLAACGLAAVGRLVYASSAEVYGVPLRNPVDEDHPLRPRSPYGAAKIGAERFIEASWRSRGLQAVVLRLFSVYGPGQPEGSVLSHILRQARSGSPGIALMDLRPVRDYCFVDDVVEAIVRATRLDLEDTYLTCNIGTGRGTSVGALARTVTSVLGIDIPITAAGPPAQRNDRPQRADIPELIADNRRAREGLGWQPQTSLSQGLRRTIDHIGASRAEDIKE